MTGRMKWGRARRKERTGAADLKSERKRMQDDAASRWLKEHSGRKQRKDRDTGDPKR
jgi:hypothetical protein